MKSDDVTLVVVSGPVGVGKTTVSEELSGLLEADKISHTFVDLDGLAKTYPRQPNDKFGERIALRNLGDVWKNARKLGVKNLIVARVVESAEGAERIERAVGAVASCIFQLNASDSSLLARVRHREIGAARAWHEKRALELGAKLRSSNVADVQIETDDKTAPQIAQEILQTIEFG
jgi:energy-coupling factor transporter ATP-binding protein EcfA2